MGGVRERGVRSVNAHRLVGAADEHLGLYREAAVGGDMAVVGDGSVAHGDASAKLVDRDRLRGNPDVDLGAEACVGRHPKRSELAIAVGGEKIAKNMRSGGILDANRLTVG